MTHDELKELVPVFALDALPPGEEDELVAHLKLCRECSDLLTVHRETAGMLAFAAMPVQAPGDLKDRILSRAAQTPQLTPSPAPVTPIRPPARSWSWQWAGLAAACLVALVAGGFAFLRLDGQTDRLNRQQEVLTAQREALALIGSPDAQVLAMAPADGPSSASGRAFVSPDDGRAAVVVAGLDRPRDDDVYTLWVIEGGTPRRVSDFTPEEGQAVVPVDESVETGSTLAVTHEPNPGNTSPEGPVVLAAVRG
ncbi:MAG TPA: anti-sigma factor [Actinomycetota bacterium]|nr:anti-sigma factor [Actinomycetota bacterium]